MTVPKESTRGRISLVGAGPGDPELLTLKAARTLADADLVLYDALVDRRVLDLAKKAKRLYVGKRRARHAVRQETIEKLLVRNARRGLHVVRLKAGDPFVFGRGGEEALAALKANVPVEIIPGVSSAFAAPLSAGIPVTHRGVSSGCLVLTAAPSDAYESVLPHLAEQKITIVLMMGVAVRDLIASFLLAHGYAADRPCAIVCGATTADAWTWVGTLAELGGVLVPDGPPGVIVLGESVKLASFLGQWSSSNAALGDIA